MVHEFDRLIIPPCTITKPLLAHLKAWIAKISKQRDSPVSLSLDLSKALNLTNENLISQCLVSTTSHIPYIYRHLALSQVAPT